MNSTSLNNPIAEQHSRKEALPKNTKFDWSEIFLTDPCHSTTYTASDFSKIASSRISITCRTNDPYKVANPAHCFESTVSESPRSFCIVRQHTPYEAGKTQRFFLDRFSPKYSLEQPPRKAAPINLGNFSKITDEEALNPPQRTEVTRETNEETTNKLKEIARMWLAETLSYLGREKPIREVKLDKVQTPIHYDKKEDSNYPGRRYPKTPELDSLVAQISARRFTLFQSLIEKNKERLGRVNPEDKKERMSIRENIEHFEEGKKTELETFRSFVKTSTQDRNSQERFLQAALTFQNLELAIETYSRFPSPSMDLYNDLLKGVIALLESPNSKNKSAEELRSLYLKIYDCMPTNEKEYLKSSCQNALANPADFEWFARLTSMVKNSIEKNMKNRHKRNVSRNPGEL